MIGLTGDTQVTMTPEIAAWLDQEALVGLHDLYKVHGEPVSVYLLEFQLVGLAEQRPAAAEAFKGLREVVRQRAVFDALKRHVDRGRAQRAGAVGETVADQLFKPSTVLDCLAEA